MIFWVNVLKSMLKILIVPQPVRIRKERKKKKSHSLWTVNIIHEVQSINDVQNIVFFNSILIQFSLLIKGYYWINVLKSVLKYSNSSTIYKKKETRK